LELLPWVGAGGISDFSAGAVVGDWFWPSLGLFWAASPVTTALEAFSSGLLRGDSIDILKMRANFKPFWVRKLIGKLRVPYNRRLRVASKPNHANSLDRPPASPR
jgi:hypothetical protein